MRYLLLLILLIAAVSVATFNITDETGYVYLRWGQWQIETSLVIYLAATLLVLMVIVLGYELLGGIFRIPGRLGRSYRKYQKQKKLVTTSRAFVNLLLGEWPKAEKQFQSSAKSLPQPVANHLAAAYAAQRSGNISRRDIYLKQARALGSDYHNAVTMFACHLDMQRGNYSDAIRDLKSLCSKLSNNPQAFRLLAKSYEATEDWNALAQILPHLKKSKAYPQRQFKSLTDRLQCRQMESAATASELLDLWKKVSSADQKNAQFSEVYVRRLLEFKRYQEAEKVIRRALNNRWDSQLAYFYGCLGGKLDNSRLYETADKWLSVHQKDPNLLLAAGKLAGSIGLWGKAQSHLEQSIKNGGGAEAYAQLGAVLERQNKSEEALKTLKAGYAPQLKKAASKNLITVPESVEKQSVD